MHISGPDYILQRATQSYVSHETVAAKSQWYTNLGAYCRSDGGNENVEGECAFREVCRRTLDADSNSLPVEWAAESQSAAQTSAALIGCQRPGLCRPVRESRESSLRYNRRCAHRRRTVTIAATCIVIGLAGRSRWRHRDPTVSGAGNFPDAAWV